MRLLNVQSGEIEEFPGWLNPVYAILSHFWGDDEVSFEDITGPDTA